MTRPKEIRIDRIVYKEAGLLYFKPTKMIALQKYQMTAESNKEVHQNEPFQVLVDNVTNTTVQVAEYMILCSCNDSVVNNIDTEQVDKEPRHTVATVQKNAKLPVQILEYAYVTKTAEMGGILSP